MPFDSRRSTEDLEKEYRGVLDAAEAKVPAEISSRAVLLGGYPSRAIVSEAKAGGHDLVVLVIHLPDESET